jgi:pimeloyl-ACP methyl ester carboxylesterase
VTESPPRLAALSEVDLAYRDEGEGPCVVLIHGLGMSGEMWRPVRSELARSRRVVAVDLRAAGATRERRRRELGLGLWAADLRELADSLGLDGVVLVGHSLGAGVALAWALERPDDVLGLVLAGAEAGLSSLAPRMLASAAAVEELGLAGWVDERWSQNPPFSAASVARDPAALAFYRELLLANDAGDYARTCRAIAAAEDLTARVGEIGVPSVVVVGEEDDRTLPEHGRELARLLPRARLVALPGVGHTIPLEAPAAVVDAVLSLGEV